MRLLTLTGIFLRGILMGVADALPGISGGTIAFITGIYERLLFNIHAVSSVFIRVRWRIPALIRGLRNELEWSFLLPLGVGIFSGALLMVHLMSWLLEHYRTEVWMFFAGLILSSAFLIWRRVPEMLLRVRILLFLLGAGTGYLLPLLLNFRMPESCGGWFAGGFLASLAMLLPGISGSALLVSVGLYESVIHALRSLTSGTLPVKEGLCLLAFFSGVLLGILGMGTLLARLFRKYSRVLVLFFAGFLVGVLLPVFQGEILQKDPSWNRLLSWVMGGVGLLVPFLLEGVLYLLRVVAPPAPASSRNQYS